MNYGAFVDLEGGGSGMVHISEISNDFVRDINDFLKVGDTVRVKVVNITAENKISLSIKALLEKPVQNQQNHNRRFSRPQEASARRDQRHGFVPGSEPCASAVQNSQNNSFEEMLSRYKKDSDDRMSDLRHVIDTRRGSNNRKSRMK